MEFNILEMEEESNTGCKRLKLMVPTQQCFYVHIPDDSSPLGLTLRKTPSFLELVEMELSNLTSTCSEPEKKKSNDDNAQQIRGKTKASNISASLLRIGSWERVSRYEGELVTKFYYAKRKLVWEVLDSGLKNKIEFLWSDIASLRATYNVNEPEILEIELLRRPLFFREVNPQPRKHTLWKDTVDFTGGEASIYRRHFVQFPQGTLQRHYEKMLQLDKRLSLLSKNPYPTTHSPFFGQEDGGNHQSLGVNQIQLGWEERSPNSINQIIDWTTNNDNAEEHLESFTPKNPEYSIAFSEANFPASGFDDSMGHDPSYISLTSSLPYLVGTFLPSIPDISISDVIDGYPYKL